MLVISTAEDGCPMGTAHTKGTGREDLREKLRRYRLDQARRERVPPYFVFWDLTLDQLCEELPRDDETLSGIHRFGGQETRDKYGEGVLEIIDGWVEDRLDKGLPLVLTTTSAHQQGEAHLSEWAVPENPSRLMSLAGCWGTLLGLGFWRTYTNRSAALTGNLRRNISETGPDTRRGKSGVYCPV